MKTLSLIIFACAASSAFALDKVAVTVNVRVDGKAVGEAKGNAEEQKRFLEIAVTNRTREELSGLVVKWAIFANDLKEGETVKAGSGEVKSSVYPQRSETIQSQTVTMNYTTRHAERTNKGKGSSNNRNRGNATYKTVEATGNRYKGWGVQVYQGAALIGEAYSTPELKNAMGSR